MKNPAARRGAVLERGNSTPILGLEIPYVYRNSECKKGFPKDGDD
jgi:hypothetical protein